MESLFITKSDKPWNSHSAGPNLGKVSGCFPVRWFSSLRNSAKMLELIYKSSITLRLTLEFW